MIVKILLILLYLSNVCYCGMEEEEGVKYANKCEVCKILATELESRLEETGKTHEVLDFGYSIDDVKPKRRQKYQKSELRLVESLDGICERVLQYNIHKERKDSTRFDKGMSQTFQTLHGLVDKGVKVELGIPYELWDKPSAEITNMKTQCETLLEENEEAIENWYFGHQGEISLKQFLCSDKALKGESDKCLDEQFPSRLPNVEKPRSDTKERKKKDKKPKKEEEHSSEDSEDESDIEEVKPKSAKGDSGDDEIVPERKRKEEL